MKKINRENQTPRRPSSLITSRRASSSGMFAVRAAMPAIAAAGGWRVYIVETKSGKVRARSSRRGALSVPKRQRLRRHRFDRRADATLVPIRPRWRGERRFLRTFPGASLRSPPAFNPRHRRLSTPTDAFQLHPDVRSYRTALTSPPKTTTSVMAVAATLPTTTTTT